MILVGVTGINELHPRLTKRANGSVVVTRRFDCPESAIGALLGQFNPQEYDQEPLDTADRYIVSFTTEPEGTTEATELSNIWTADWNHEQLSLWAAEEVVAEMSKLSIEVQATVRADIEAFLDGERTFLDSNGVEHPLSYPDIKTTLTAAGLNVAVLDAMVRSRLNGTETWTDSTPVLRRRLELPASNQLTPVFQSINFVYTTNALFNFESSVPVNLRSAIMANPILVNGYWIRKAPTAEQQTNGKWLYTVDYFFTVKYDSFAYTTLVQ